MAEPPGGIEPLDTTGTSVNEDENEGEEDKKKLQQEKNEGDNGEKRKHEDEKKIIVDDNEEHPKSNSVLIYTVRSGIWLILFFMVLSCITLSKLTLIQLTNRLRTLTVAKNLSSDNKEVATRTDKTIGPYTYCSAIFGKNTEV